MTNFRMPAEWEPHEATWLAWPHDLETWPKQIEEIETLYIEIIRQLHVGEKVNILVDDTQTEDHVSKKLREYDIVKNVVLHMIETDSIWVRDYGPTFATQNNGSKSLIKWKFNAWGGKYSYQKDRLVSSKLARILNLKPFETDLVLEGGSIDVNGSGVLMTTEECLLNPNRNPQLKREQIEQSLKNFLGVKKIIWLGKGIEGDDTDGHVDEIARFVSTNKIVIGMDRDENPYNYQVLIENRKRLRNTTDEDGKPFEIIEVPMPSKVRAGKLTLPASYVNFYIGNKCVLVPIFNDKNDTKALGILRDLFPKRNVVGIPAVPLIYGQGAIHCMTQQEPAHAA